MRAFQHRIRALESQPGGTRQVGLRREYNLILRGGGGPRFDLQDMDAIKAYYRRYGLVCVRNGLTDRTHAEIARATRHALPTADVRQKSRLTTCLSNDAAARLYKDPQLQYLFRELHDYALRPTDFPVEFRVYPPTSAGMAWHQDLKLTQPMQTEMVYTVENHNSASRLVWKIEGGARVSVRPEKGDLVFVLPNRADHKVTSMKGGGGTRSILKFLSYPEGTQKLKQFYIEKKQALKQNV